MRGRLPDGWSRIVSYHIRCTSVRTTAVRRSDGEIQTAILALWTHASGRDTTSSGRLIDLPFLEFGKNQWTVRELIGVRTCCWDVWTDQAGTETSRYSEVSGRKKHVVRTDDAGLSGVRTVWHIVRTDGAVDRWASGWDDTSSGWLTGNLNCLLILTSLWKWNPCLQHLYT